MLYKAIAAIVFKGDKIRIGQKVEMTDAEAEVYAGSVKPDAPVANPVEEQEEVKPLDELSHAELKAKAEHLGLSKSGSKADLVERITLHLQKEVEEMIDFEVTEEYLGEHPELAEKGVKVGDVVKVPAEGEITND